MHTVNTNYIETSIWSDRIGQRVKRVNIFEPFYYDPKQEVRFSEFETALNAQEGNKMCIHLEETAVQFSPSYEAIKLEANPLLKSYIEYCKNLANDINNICKSNPEIKFIFRGELFTNPYFLTHTIKNLDSNNFISMEFRVNFNEESISLSRDYLDTYYTIIKNTLNSFAKSNSKLEIDLYLRECDLPNTYSDMSLESFEKIIQKAGFHYRVNFNLEPGLDLKHETYQALSYHYGFTFSAACNLYLFNFLKQKSDSKIPLFTADVIPIIMSYLCDHSISEDNKNGELINRDFDSFESKLENIGESVNRFYDDNYEEIAAKKVRNRGMQTDVNEISNCIETQTEETTGTAVTTQTETNTSKDTITQTNFATKSSCIATQTEDGQPEDITLTGEVDDYDDYLNEHEEESKKGFSFGFR